MYNGTNLLRKEEESGCADLCEFFRLRRQTQLSPKVQFMRTAQRRPVIRLNVDYAWIANKIKT